MRNPVRWAIKETCDNKLDGHREWFHWDGTLPFLFRTRREAREYINEHFGYIRNRPDLQREPHCWKIPKPVKVRVELHELI